VAPAVAHAPGDFDGDGDLDVDDVDALSRAIAEQSSLVEFDVDQDGFVSYGDLTTWLVDMTGHQPGDANLDGSVDALDFTIWNTHRFQSDTVFSQGDFDASGVTDGSDFAIWNNNRFTIQAATVDTDNGTSVPRAALARYSNSPSLLPNVSDTSERSTGEVPAIELRGRERVFRDWRPRARYEREAFADSGRARPTRNNEDASEVDDWSNEVDQIFSVLNTLS
jgi:hypothetical protein